MHIPLGVALANFIKETGIPTIAYHHDFYRKRERFLRNNSVLGRPSRFDRSLSLIYNGSDPHGTTGLSRCKRDLQRMGAMN